MQFSRNYAHKAQKRETETIQPKEYLTGGIKAQINIRNYLGGVYYFTCDEARIEGNTVFIIEGKHTKDGVLPSLDDIKDGLLKMMLYANLRDVCVDGRVYIPKPVLKLTSGALVCSETAFDYANVGKQNIISALRQEAQTNNFETIFPARDTND